MSAEIVFYTNPKSRGQIAHWMLEETGQPYKQVILEFGEAMKSPEYLAINPMGKVPAIQHAGRVVTEAAAICLYLADAFPTSGLRPEADERADYYRWLLFAAGPVEQAVTARVMGWSVPKEKEGMVGFGNYDATVTTLEQALSERDYVCGARFTAADVYVGSTVSWGLAFGTLPKRPAFEAYAARVTSRPAYPRAG